MLETNAGKQFRAADFHQDRLNPWLAEILNNPEFQYAVARQQQLPKEGLRLLDLHFATIYRRANDEIKAAALSDNEAVLSSVRAEYNRLIEYYRTTKDFKVILKPEDLHLQQEPYEQEQVILHLEGGDIITDPDIINDLYERGIRSIQPVYSHDNLLGGGASGNKNRGLTNLGKRVIQRMMELGMIIDTAHANHKTANDILEEVGQYNRAVTTHTGLGTEEQRYITPAILKKIAAKGGVVGFTPLNAMFPSFRDYINAYKLASDLTGSTKHLAVGTDLGGVDADMLFEEFRQINDLARIAEQLSEIAGFTDEQVADILYGNIARIINSLEKK